MHSAAVATYFARLLVCRSTKKEYVFVVYSIIESIDRVAGCVCATITRANQCHAEPVSLCRRSRDVPDT